MGCVPTRTRREDEGHDVPRAILRWRRANGDAAAFILDARESMRLGRSPACELRVPDGFVGVSREHALLESHDAAHHIRELASRNGTFVNGRALGPDDVHRLGDGDEVGIGPHVFVYRLLGAGPRSDSEELDIELVRLVGSLGSLDARQVVETALRLLRRVSGVDRALLIGTGSSRFLDPLLTPIDDPVLHLSRSTIESAVESGRPTERVIEDPDDGDAIAQSIRDLSLRWIWVAPVLGAHGRPVAAVYLDSGEQTSPMSNRAITVMAAVCQQVGVALRNAELHAELEELTRELEARVEERTRERDETRTRLVARAQHATLGRLVAAIAHELNNPAAALAAMATSLISSQAEIEDASEQRHRLARSAYSGESLSKLFARLEKLSASPSSDSKTRRAAEHELLGVFAEAGSPRAQGLARRWARLGVTAADLAPFPANSEDDAETLIALAETVVEFRRGLYVMQTCSREVSRIVKGLRTYAHLDRAEQERVDLRGSLDATLSVLASRIPPRIRVVTHYDEVEAFPHHPGQMTQVWTNLIDNALTAMGDEEGVLRVSLFDRGDDAVVEIADSGPGIPSSMRARLFDLDATTRGPGAGLGLGLPICRQIVECSHEGSISFDSDPGRTAFVVRLPKRAASENRTDEARRRR